MGSTVLQHAEEARGWGQVGLVPHHLINISLPQFNSLCPTCDAFVPTSGGWLAPPLTTCVDSYTPDHTAALRKMSTFGISFHGIILDFINAVI